MLRYFQLHNENYMIDHCTWLLYIQKTSTLMKVDSFTSLHHFCLNLRQHCLKKAHLGAKKGSNWKSFPWNSVTALALVKSSMEKTLWTQKYGLISTDKISRNVLGQTEICSPSKMNLSSGPHHHKPNAEALGSEKYMATLHRNLISSLVWVQLWQPKDFMLQQYLPQHPWAVETLKLYTIYKYLRARNWKRTAV